MPGQGPVVPTTVSEVLFNEEVRPGRMYTYNVDAPPLPSSAPPNWWSAPVTSGIGAARLEQMREEYVRAMVDPPRLIPTTQRVYYRSQPFGVAEAVAMMAADSDRVDPNADDT